MMTTVSELIADVRRQPIAWLVRVLSGIPVLLIPVAWAPQAAWKLGMRAYILFLLIALGYAALVLALRLGEMRGRPPTILRTLMIGASCFAPLLIVALTIKSRYFDQRSILIALVLALVLGWLSATWHRRDWVPRAVIIVLTAVAAVAMQFAIIAGAFAKPDQPSLQAMSVRTALYELRVNAYRNWVPHQKTQQGGIAAFADRYLLATGDGDLFLFREDPSGKTLDTQKLKRRTPIDFEKFNVAMAGVGVPIEWFRVADVLTQKTPDGVRVFISHHWWDEADQCFVMRVSVFEGTQEDFVADAAPGAWRTLFDTKPCMKIMTPGRAPRFGGLENGGRLAQFDDQHVLLSVGDHAIDGWGDTTKIAQDPNASYGKTVLIDIGSGKNELFTMGHRNPQGLLVTASHHIWSTEHGPQGGDELNELHAGGNYGWPLATYGTQYGTRAWPLTETPGAHEHFVSPMYSWIPSIGVSNLVEIDSPLFEYWRGDLIVGSLLDRELWRLRMREGRVVMVEHFRIGERIRDLIVGQRGELVIWTDRESLMFATPQANNTESAPSLYTVCAQCHVPLEGQSDAIGPTLVGVVRRKVGSVEGFNYSDAMRRAGGTWTKQRLDAFLENPNSAVPGTIMQFGGIPDPTSRRQLIEFLSSATEDQLERAAAPGML